MLKLNVLSVGVFAVFLSVSVCTFMLQQPWYGMCLCMLCVSVYLFMDARLPSQIWRLVAHPFEGWRNWRGRLKYSAVIGIALSSVSSINVQFSI